MSFSQSAVFIGYSPNDYFYNNAITSGDPYAPNDDDCAALKDMKIDCSHENFHDTSFNCIQQEMCINQKLANDLSIQNSNNGGERKFEDEMYSFKHLIIQSVNLGIGICVIIYFLYLRRKINIEKRANII